MHYFFVFFVYYFYYSLTTSPISSFTMSLCLFVAMTSKILCEIHRSRKYVRRLGFFEMKDNGENWFGFFGLLLCFVCEWMRCVQNCNHSPKLKLQSAEQGSITFLMIRPWSFDLDHLNTHDRDWKCLQKMAQSTNYENAGYLFKGF